MTKLHLKGCDGSFWDLQEWPVRHLAEETEGLYEPEVEVQTRSAARVDGQTIVGREVMPREGNLPVLIRASEDSGSLLSVERAWRRAWSHTAYSELVVTAPNNEQRTLRVRKAGVRGSAPATNPEHYGYVKDDVRFIADDPWWYGRPVVREFLKDPTDRNFFGPLRADGQRMGPPFYLFSDANLGQQFLSNPGDEPSWPVVRVRGPVTEFEFRIDSKRVAGNYAVPAGAVLTVDARPGAKSAVLLDGSVRSNVTRAALTAWDFPAVPAGSAVEAFVTFVGDGSIEVEFLPQFWTAWS